MSHFLECAKAQERPGFAQDLLNYLQQQVGLPADDKIVQSLQQHNDIIEAMNAFSVCLIDM